MRERMRDNSRDRARKHRHSLYHGLVTNKLSTMLADEITNTHSDQAKF